MMVRQRLLVALVAPHSVVRLSSSVSVMHLLQRFRRYGWCSQHALGARYGVKITGSFGGKHGLWNLEAGGTIDASQCAANRRCDRG